MTMLTVTSDKSDALVLNRDGVVTAAARIHAVAWKQASDLPQSHCPMVVTT
jgi:hypothetical protein